ncbi:hypothetical protein D3C86_1098790 [compost metagenome]
MLFLSVYHGDKARQIIKDIIKIILKKTKYLMKFINYDGIRTCGCLMLWIPYLILLMTEIIKELSIME